MRRIMLCAACLGVLAVALFLVSQTGGLPEPWGSWVGQHLSRTFHFLFLLLSILFLLAGSLRSGESRIGRVLWTAGAVVLNFAVVETLKHIVFWPRPIDVGQTTTTASRGSGFPSGHTVPDFLVAVLVGYLEPRLQVAALVAASLVGYSRAEVTAHFPIQVWISALIGMGLGLLWTAIHTRFTSRATA